MNIFLDILSLEFTEGSQGLNQKFLTPVLSSLN